MESLVYREDADRIDRIASVNARYIIDTLPDHLYSHTTRGDMLRISTQPLPPDASWRIVLLGFCHQVAGGEVNIGTYILHEDGRVYGYDERSGKLPYGMSYLHRNMLLQGVDFDPWKLQRKCAKTGKEIGIQLEEGVTGYERYFSVVMENVRGAYGRIL